MLFLLELFTFLRSVRKVFLKTTNEHQRRRDSVRTKWQLALDFTFVFSMETCHVVGLAILVFVALPNVDTPHALVLTNCFALIPAILLIDSDIRLCQKSKFLQKIKTFANFRGQEVKHTLCYLKTLDDCGKITKKELKRSMLSPQ